MKTYKRLVFADLTDLIVIVVAFVPIVIVLLSKIESPVLWGALFSLSIILTSAFFICRDWNNGLSLGKRIFRIQLQIDNKSKNQRRKIYMKRNYDIGIEMAVDLFLFRYAKRLKNMNEKYGIRLVEIGK